MKNKYGALAKKAQRELDYVESDLEKTLNKKSMDTNKMIPDIENMSTQQAD